MGESAAWWKGIDAAMLANISGKIHPGAVKFYKEKGLPLTDAQM
jgi:TRAP-type uncharacterized transport system substrate-binding protein